MSKIHFIGVSGIGVSAVARLAALSGEAVTGSADEKNELTEELAKLGVTVFLGHKGSQVGDADLVVRSAAVRDDNAEVVATRRRGIPLLYYADYLATLMARKKSVAIAGTHGKTTTTAMAGTVLNRAGLRPTIVCGGVMRDFGSNAVSGDGDYLVAEACEYNRSFLSFPKRYAVVGNIEADHLDTYADIDDIKGAFAQFLRRIEGGGFAVVNGDDENVIDAAAKSGTCRTVTVGKALHNSYRLAGIREKEGLYECVLFHGRSEAAHLTLPVPGEYNVRNAALAATLCLEIGVDRKTVEDAIAEFKGLERRLETLGMRRGNVIYSDYAHHPTEIRSVVDALRRLHPKRRLMVVFQPHQYSRTAYLFDGFVEALSAVDVLVITEVYRQRDPERFVRSISGKDLHEAIVKKKTAESHFIDRKEEVIPFLEEHGREGDVVVFMGAGDIDAVARRYVKGGD
ncbi:MAG: UDP-N-acetylmuramate--L-alanine ligase [Spirochaetes bacterium]|nr:UDP-N-acetylmuramate--L-alanine ligase [Spirochaetota bacterium]